MNDVKRRPRRPDIRVGDRVEVEVCAWQGAGSERRWAPTGETFETVAGIVGWDAWLEGGSWWIALQSGKGRPGRVAAQHVRALDRAGVPAWSEPDLFEAAFGTVA